MRHWLPAVLGTAALALQLGMARADDVRRETVKFAPGASSAKFAGRFKGYDSVEYTLGAEAGQRLTVTFKARGGASYFNVLAPGNPEALAEPIEHSLGASQNVVADLAGIERRTQRPMQPQIHAERPVRQPANLADHRAQVVRRDVETGQHTQSAGATHLGHELGTGNRAHAGLDDRVFDPEQIAQRRAERHRRASPEYCGLDSAAPYSRR